MVLTLFSLYFLIIFILEFLNRPGSNRKINKNVSDIFNTAEFDKSKNYNVDKYFYSYFTDVIGFILMFLGLYLGWFGKLGGFVQLLSDNVYFRCLAFFFIIFFIYSLFGFFDGLYENFVIEKKYGFNKLNLKTYILDNIKINLLTFFVGGLVLFVLQYFFENYKEVFWLMMWGFISIFNLIVIMFYTSIFLPIFNKLKPLQDGELKNEIMEYANKNNFKIDNIFVMDGSKRSTKANAFFSGLGKSKKIVLFDTLINTLSVKEVVAVLAHEMGHYKKKHTFYMFLISFFQLGIMCYMFNLISKYSLFIEEIHFGNSSFYALLFTFSIIYAPISFITSIFLNILSRKMEYQADNYAITSYFKNDMVSALKKLTKNHLSDLNPHPAYVFANYSHPPLYQRLEKINKND